MKTCGCGDDIAPGRWALGYRECLTCGEEKIRANPPTRCAVPLNKSNYMLITNRAELKQLNPKYTHR
jgi:hypothetical protein